MEIDFWLNIWNEKQIGFHQSSFNPKMVEFFSKYNLKDKKVFVPLCGKSHDMIWLANQGAHVVGVEVSPIAVKEFFEENNITFKIDKTAEGEWFRSESIDILLGDFFHLNETHFDFIYDRAAMVALPEEIRQRYQEKIKTFANNAEYFLFTFEYDQEKFQGPPFSVIEKEVFDVFQLFKIKKIFEQSEKSDFRGVSLMVKRVVYLINNGN